MLGRSQTHWVCGDDCVKNGLVGAGTAVAITKVYSMLNNVDVPLPITLEAGAITGASVAVSDMVVKSQPNSVKAFSPVLSGVLLAGSMQLLKNDKAWSLWFPLGVVSHLVGKRLTWAYSNWEKEQGALNTSPNGTGYEAARKATLNMPKNPALNSGLYGSY